MEPLSMITYLFLLTIIFTLLSMYANAGYQRHVYRLRNEDNERSLLDARVQIEEAYDTIADLKADLNTLAEQYVAERAANRSRVADRPPMNFPNDLLRVPLGATLHIDQREQ